MIFKVIVLGVLQGLTEFLPVSSSGHLVIGQHLLGFGQSELMLDVSLHVGTLAAVVFFLRRELWRILVQLPYLPKLLGPAETRAQVWAEQPDLKLAVLVVVGTIPTGLIGLLFRKPLEAAFASVALVGLALIFTGVLLALTAFIGRGERGVSGFGLGRALILGVAQGLAIIPGVSRSGTTIAVGLFANLDRTLAARFSFLLSIPAILGALVLQLVKAPTGSVSPGLMVVGALAAAVVGYLALALLVWIVGRGKMWYFAPYCLVLGGVALFLR